MDMSMAMDGIVALNQAKKYVDESLKGVGALVGKNVTISSITQITGGNRITFSYTPDGGTPKASHIDVMDGKDGTTITDAKIDDDNKLILTLSDNTVVPAGTITTLKGDKGDDGITPTIEVGDVTTLPPDRNATVYITGTSRNIKINFGIPKGEDGVDGGNSTDEKVKLSSNSVDAHYLDELIDNSTIEIDDQSNKLIVKRLDGQNVTIAEINFLYGVTSNIQEQINNISKSMSMYGVFDTKQDLLDNTEPIPVDGNTAIVVSDESNDGKQMTYIYIEGSGEWTPVAESSIQLRDFSTNPLDLETETTGILSKEKIDVAIARLANVLDKNTYKGSTDGVVKSADTLEGLLYTIQELNRCINDSHSHLNKTTLDKIVENGLGNRFLSDDGTYKELLVISSVQPLDEYCIWIDNANSLNLVLKIFDGTNWVPISGTGGNGKSAYQIAVNNGFNGTETEWLESLKGVDGKNGDTPYIKDGHWWYGDIDSGVAIPDIEDLLEYVNGEHNIEDTPIGFIMPYMGNVVPKHYLTCDGGIYPIVDFQVLADHIKEEFGEYDFFGGDATGGTFAVPDLRGEFLRGAGTNSRSSQGNGADVGKHQNATTIPYTLYHTDGTIHSKRSSSTASSIPLNVDYSFNSADTYSSAFHPDGKSPDPNSMYTYSARPTNTSVMWCIKYEHTFYVNAGEGGEGTTDYDKLNNKPKINNVELAGNKTLDDLGIQPKGEYALISEAGYSLVLSVDPETYVMEIKLKNKSGEDISTQQFDFPIETAFVNVGYNKETHEITFTLQNGTTTEPIDISDIVRGLVPDGRTIAGLDLKDDISTDELKNALGIPDFANVVTSVNGKTGVVTIHELDEEFTVDNDKGGYQTDSYRNVIEDVQKGVFGNGYISMTEVIQNLDSYIKNKLGIIKSLTADDDLNTIKSNGIYTMLLQASTEKHYPYDEYFQGALTVYSVANGERIVQILNNAFNNKMFYRSYHEYYNSASHWKAWQEVITVNADPNGDRAIQTKRFITRNASYEKSGETTYQGEKIPVQGGAVFESYKDPGVIYYTSSGIDYGHNFLSFDVVGNYVGTVRCEGSKIHANNINTTGADYAEMWEWADSNPNGEDRRGLFVTLDDNKIRPANDNDYILGVVSDNAGVIGNSYPIEWQGKYLTDVYGRVKTHIVHYDAIYEDKETVNPETGEITTKRVLIREEMDIEEPMLNPDYDPEEKYIPRSKRKEWAVVGLMGQLIVTDDGTCEVNGYCKATNGGIATYAETGYRVLERLDDMHIKILFK